MDIVATLLSKRAATQPQGQPMTQNAPVSVPAPAPAAPRDSAVTVTHQGKPPIGAATQPFSMMHPMYPGGTSVKTPPVDPNMQQMPPPEPPPPIEPVTHVPTLSDPKEFFKGLSKRVDSLLAKYSSDGFNPWASFDSPLDPGSPTGRAGGTPPPLAANPFKSPGWAFGYDMLRKILLGPALNVGQKPMGGLTDTYSDAAQPYHTEAARIQALSSPRSPGAAMLANFAGSALGGHNPSAESWQAASDAAGLNFPR